MKGKMLLCFAICVVLFTDLHGQHAGWLWAKACGGASDKMNYYWDLWDGEGGSLQLDYDYGEHGSDIAIDSGGNIFTVGYFSGVSTFGSISLNSISEIALYVAKMNENGNYLWVKRLCASHGYSEVGGPNSFSISRQLHDDPQIAIDGSGNIVVTGTYVSTTTFGPTTLSGSGAFVCKLDNNGNYLWAKRVCGSVYSNYYTSIGIRSVAIDDIGNIYVAGGFSGTQTFGTIALQASGNSDVFYAKLDSEGNFIIAKKYGGAGEESGACVAVDNQGNAYLLGEFLGTSTFGATSLSSASSYYADVFTIRLNSDGEVVWAKRIGGQGYDWAKAIQVDSVGNLYILCYFGSTTNASFETTPIVGGFLKIDINGNLIWSRQIKYGSDLAIASDGIIFTTGKDGDNWDVIGCDITKWNSDGTIISKDIGGLSDCGGCRIILDDDGDCYIHGLFSRGWSQSINHYFSNTTIAGMGMTSIVTAKFRASANHKQRLLAPDNVPLSDITNNYSTPASGFTLKAWISSRPEEVISTATHLQSVIRLYRYGNGSSLPYETKTYLELGAFDTPWSANDVLHYELTKHSDQSRHSWDVIIPDSYPAAWPTNADIQVDLQPLLSPIVGISNIGANIQLSWIAVPGASSYRVEKCNDLSEPFVFVESTSQLSFAVSSTEQSAFFRVVSASGDIESVPSAITGYVRYDLVAGYNCIALPLIQDTIFTSELSTLFDNSVSTISIWNHTTQAWTTAVNYGGGFWDPDISLSPGSVLLIYANSPISYYSIGLLPDSHAQYTFVVGDNAVMIPLNKSALSDTALSGISMGDGQAVNTISVWNPAIQGWESTVNFGNGYWDPIYSTNIGTPLFLNSYSIETWPMGPRAEPQSGIKRLMEKK